MTIRQTHTYATLEISKAAYDEIKTKLQAAGYGHVFMDDGAIDMHGLAVVNYVDNAPTPGQPIVEPPDLKKLRDDLT